MSRIPSVVTNAVRAPLRSMSALVASVVPWTKTETSDGAQPGRGEHAPDAFEHARLRAPRVVSTLAVSRPARTLEHDVGEGAADVGGQLAARHQTDTFANRGSRQSSVSST